MSSTMKRASRQENVEIAQETLRILQSTEYGMADGARIDLGSRLEVAIAGTILYPESEEIDFTVANQNHRGTIEVRNETTLAAGKRLSDSIRTSQGEGLCILNFASAKNPGGGFQTGAEAQEESLARASGLYVCLQGHNDDFYEPNRRNPKDGLYSHSMLYSPQVPFFRNDAGALCLPWYASVITAPAPNAGVATKKCGAAQVKQSLHERCGRILRIAKLQKQTHLVLGAYGCGVFQNDPKEVAEAFDAWLRTEFAGAFQHVVFAILGSSKNNNLSIFRNHFHEASASGCSAGYASGSSRTKSQSAMASNAAASQAQFENAETGSKKGRWRKKSNFQEPNSIPISMAGVQQWFDFFIVLDFEATCDEGRPPQPQEIIELPLVLVDAKTLRVVDEFRSYVQPQHHRTLTTFCRNLTGIQQHQIDEAPSFRDAFQQACAWLEQHGLLRQERHSAALVTCGDWDLKTMLPAQCKVAKLQKIPQLFREWVNIKKTYTAATGKHARGMTEMLDGLGLPLVGHHHSGLDDCRNIAQILISICRHHAVELNGWI
eukprot:gnl/MRDRNA2_/MRDRNA2_93829_c0_seq1.p1 gnl/MRDRNA2_/MRDRNA2_93829_c0~~gnl/MRDRNA2_/MRDRNA2_93829_c0_seq1.p1  ORF type:complete len:547 (+),score=89.45 gnl/MRDRNA2_/MRDRNA2_93829_c0_seq1:81-1721(+)